MPQIVNKSYFNKANILYIPLASEAPLPSAVTSTPNDGAYIDALCIEIEKTILVNALGLTTYNELQLALADIDNPLYASYKKLVQGDEYDDKIWIGLEHDLNLIAQAVWIEYVSEKNTNLSAVGNSQVNVEKGTLVTPMYKIANASVNFIKQYQGEYLNEPYVNGIFVDWLGNNEGVYVSLYRYLVDKKTDFPNVNLDNFTFYEQINSFGI
ncbi:structural protein [Flavobacterium phage vB_FspS_snork6-2]|uniref:Structural protein n=8 Tax=Lillamyvirus TaxID=2843418 RepID=A0A6B9LNN6_9CAUD|nr:structural protein [Flavobacterium phage vB_FspS_lillamy9-1]YP_009855268.1 structural protein [Flavobacterium phage vB_FspS_snork6-1]QHB39159.1 structural protein [Flavobacterium phage vB_FspS_lillamy9-2]QHB39305.1 structural protein [Flavobacterium phage vB_FspS_lillamy9-4]QHB39378.1 structural protein [Flavobacterium phage vB_FspS_lillamy9-5]QHB39519.1 structural protein [Flavobacterium phage vB_FspS_lillamy9-7]QHB40486.1 structural protein [Flavobacterium phage vB_FspS_snork6-2]QHB4055